MLTSAHQVSDLFGMPAQAVAGGKGVTLPVLVAMASENTLFPCHVNPGAILEHHIEVSAVLGMTVVA